MLKVLHILHQSSPNISGSSTRTNLILKWTSTLGIENVALTSPFQEPFEKKLATKIELFPKIAVKVYRSYIFKNLSVGLKSSTFIKIKKIITLPYFFFRIAHVIRRENPDILHAHATFLCAAPTIFWGWLFKKPVVYELRSLWFENDNFKASNLTKRLAASLEKFCLNNCQKIVTISDGLKNYVEALPQNNKQRSVSVIKNGIDDDSITTCAPLQNRDLKQRFGYVGSVIELEGLDYVIHALKILSDQGVEIDFHIYGDGSSRKALESLSDSLGVSVHFHGKFHPDEALNIYNQLDTIINYRKSGEVSEKVTPLKPLEALLHRKNLICSNVGGYKEILDGDHAIFIQADNPSLLAQAILTQHLNRYNHLDLINKGFAFVTKERLWSKNGEKYLELYRSTL
ncbi:hypothetical protein B0D71_12025 [Pseudomonas laurylsulfativorans]|uniref:Glycosyltransferase subfamily 4-like N-terminal domain-containing protein n=1 Tax=Pseudomonas laurylsulfativorans TaxID=1943631 RepID=A0A2S3VQE1_9PSED|nr:glycosyltransferase family 4 protein [Pseudomonas laurylsulfativorans]POF42166.1 hypothetical protein B0D71_12025 [Pseudomonas laurylsulfativorans]